MVLIPEESAPEDEEADDEEEQTNMNPGDWRDVEAEGRQFWSGFDAVYDKYSEQMLFYDRLHAQQLREFGNSSRLYVAFLPDKLNLVALICTSGSKC